MALLILYSAGTVRFTTCTDKLTFAALWAQGFMCLSSHFQRQVIHKMFVIFSMSSHLAVPKSCLPLSVISHSTFAILCLRTRLWVNLRRWGTSNIVAISWLWFLKKGIISVGHRNFSAWIKCFKFKIESKIPFFSPFPAAQKAKLYFFLFPHHFFESGFIWVSYMLWRKPNCYWPHCNQTFNKWQVFIRAKEHTEHNANY
jgi:hypothetical protein